MARRCLLDWLTMAEVDELTRTASPIAGDETATLLGSLDRQRRTFAWKCGDLDAAALATRLTPSAMTLGGLLKHMAHVEDDMIVCWLRDEELGAPWDEVDWDADEDWDWTSAADDSPDELYGIWRDAVERSRTAVAAAIADGGVGQLGRMTTPSGNSPNLRYILIVLIEEYARHIGHADLIRESIDGLVGEDPPR